jgi:hypothetical protein
METKAKKIINVDNKQEDLVAQGFHKIDDNLIEKRPPKIAWGSIYKRFADQEKITYLEKLSATMNHAAYLIQNERNQINELCSKKEEQLENMKSAMEQNMTTLQSEMTKMNLQRQLFNERVSELNKEIKELKRGNID